MIAVSDRLAAILAGPSITPWELRVSSLRGSTVLAASVPVVSGTLTEDASLDVPEQVDLVVPREADNFDWSPIADDHPLKSNGQKLSIAIVIDGEAIQVGVFPIYESYVEGDEVVVTCYGMMWPIAEAQLVDKFAPTGTFASALRALLEPQLTVVIDPDLTDRSIPSSDPNFDGTLDRLGAVNELLAAWPATLTRGTDGVAYVGPVVELGDPVKTLQATVITPAGKSSRESQYNTGVAEGSDSDGNAVQGVAYLTTGTRAYPGPYSQLPIPKRISSPLFTSTAEAQTGAKALIRQIAASVQDMTLAVVPDPRLQLGDPVEVVTSSFTGKAVVSGKVLPLVADNEMPPLQLTIATSFEPGVQLATPPAPAETGTLTVSPVQTATWRVENSKWRTDNDYVYQGQWDAGQMIGVAFYGTALSSLSGKTVTSATVHVKRRSAGGHSSAQQLHLALFTQSTKPSGAPTKQSDTTTDIPSLAWGEEATITVPTTWVQDIVDGTAGALGLYAVGTAYSGGSSPQGDLYVQTEGLNESATAWKLVVQWSSS